MQAIHISKPMPLRVFFQHDSTPPFLRLALADVAVKGVFIIRLKIYLDYSTNVLKRKEFLLDLPDKKREKFRRFSSSKKHVFNDVDTSSNHLS